MNDCSFKKNFNEIIKHAYNFNDSILRAYQVQAIKSAIQLDQPGRLVMAPGSGKSIIQSTLALFAYHVSNSTQRIYIVTPQIDLVMQFYKDLINYNKLLKEKNDPLYIPSQFIITVCSHPSSVSVDALVTNEPYKHEKSITICCEDSFKKLLAKDLSLVTTSSLILLDEYHEYQSTVEAVCNSLNMAGPLIRLLSKPAATSEVRGNTERRTAVYTLVHEDLSTVSTKQFADAVGFGKKSIIASSATPPKKDLITTYSLKDALNGPFHSPVSIGSFDLDYSKKNVLSLLQCLPQIIQHHYHPGFRDPCTLAETKGVIYVDSIKLCDQLKDNLIKSGIVAYAIHSTNDLSSSEVKKFVSGQKPGVLVAVKKLRFGFDCSDLAGLEVTT